MFLQLLNSFSKNPCKFVQDYLIAPAYTFIRHPLFTTDTMLTFILFAGTNVTGAPSSALSASQPAALNEDSEGEYYDISDNDDDEMSATSLAGERPEPLSEADNAFVAEVAGAAAASQSPPVVNTQPILQDPQFYELRTSIMALHEKYTKMLASLKPESVGGLKQYYALRHDNQLQVLDRLLAAKNLDELHTRASAEKTKPAVQRSAMVWQLLNDITTARMLTQSHSSSVVMR